MSLTVFNGLPTHVLLVHFVVVLVPLAALALVAAAVWPPAARRLGLVLPVLALVTLAFVPLTTHAGEWLKDRLPQSDLVNQHAELGDGLLPWAIALVVMSAVVWWITRREVAAASARAGAGGSAQDSAQPEQDPARPAPAFPGRPRALRTAAAVLAVVAAAGSVVEVYRIGDSGAKAAWQGTVSQSGAHGDGDDH
jgi:MFS superfamily sulfate permease-like transporter